LKHIFAQSDLKHIPAILQNYGSNHRKNVTGRLILPRVVHKLCRKTLNKASFLDLNNRPWYYILAESNKGQYKFAGSNQFSSSPQVENLPPIPLQTCHLNTSKKYNRVRPVTNIPFLRDSPTNRDCSYFDTVLLPDCTPHSPGACSCREYRP
jgi:hypothetical protein